MKIRTLLIAGIGAGIVVWLIWRSGPSKIGHAILRLGLGGAAMVLVFQLGLAALAGLAWAMLGHGRRQAQPLRFILARLVRDAGQVLPFTQVAGVAMGARSLKLEGVPGDFAMASTLADVTLELVAQLGYVAIGAGFLALKAKLQPGLILGVGAGLAGLTAVFVLARRVAPRVAGRLKLRMPRGWLKRLAEFLSRPAATRTHAPVATRALACLLHLSAWVLTGVQAWLVLRLLHNPVSVGAAIAIDSMSSAAKAVGFFLPAGLAVQEGALIFFGQMFGVPPSTALALSFIRRGRDIALAIPILAAWQMRYGDRLWRFGRSRGSDVA